MPTKILQKIEGKRTKQMIPEQTSRCFLRTAILLNQIAKSRPGRDHQIKYAAVKADSQGLGLSNSQIVADVGIFVLILEELVYLSGCLAK
ncbi:MAG: hypothetical protein V2I56_19780 [Desulfobacteraceae bacterium]|jgi:hypothetical protein|nr:hypothetical protein [Desulfobacteraceae bacterium]